MHTTELPNGWIAKHDGTVHELSTIGFRKIGHGNEHNEYDIEIPYSVMTNFVAEQIRKNKIEEWENKPVSEIIEDMFL